MAYHGHIQVVKKYLAELPHAPSFLEVGVDRGVTFITLVAFLARNCPMFSAIGIDVLVQPQVRIMLDNLDLTGNQSAFLIEENSLSALPKLNDRTFDIILLDGDHNYHTVSQELVMLEGLINPGGAIIVDDYHGKWGTTDLWYAERDGYAGVSHTTKRVETLQRGVKPAVDEWLASRPLWKAHKMMEGEPVVLLKDQPL